MRRKKEGEKVTISTLNIPLVISASTFLSIILIFMGVFFYFRQRAKKVRFVERLAQGEESLGVPDISASSSKTAGMLLNSFSLLGKRFATEGSADYSQTQANFFKAGIRNRNVFYVFWGWKCGFPS